MPQERILYFGDTAHLPYGDKSPEVLQGYVHQIVAFLLAQQVKAIVIACNTASAVAYKQTVRQAAGIPTFEVITPAVETALAHSPQGRVGVIGTKTTVQSHIYLRTVLDHRPDASVIEKATPLLVPMIEEGWAHNKITKEIIEAYLSDTGFTHIETLILGCTHYPLIEAEIQQYFDTHARQPVRVINSAQAVAASVRASLEAQNLASVVRASPAPDQFWVSDYTEGFQATARQFFGADVMLQKKEL